MIVHAMATWETPGAKEDMRRPTRSRSRRPRVCHGTRITCLDCLLPLAAAALHQLQRVLPELLLLAGHEREARTTRTFAAPPFEGVLGGERNQWPRAQPAEAALG